MKDEVRIWWETRDTADDMVFYICKTSSPGLREHRVLFSSFYRDDFFRRYDAVVVSKAPKEEADNRD